MLISNNIFGPKGIVSNITTKTLHIKHSLPRFTAPIMVILKAIKVYIVVIVKKGVSIPLCL